MTCLLLVHIIDSAWLLRVSGGRFGSLLSHGPSAVYSAHCTSHCQAHPPGLSPASHVMLPTSSSSSWVSTPQRSYIWPGDLENQESASEFLDIPYCQLGLTLGSNWPLFQLLWTEEHSRPKCAQRDSRPNLKSPSKGYAVFSQDLDLMVPKG